MKYNKIRKQTKKKKLVPRAAYSSAQNKRSHTMLNCSFNEKIRRNLCVVTKVGENDIGNTIEYLHEGLQKHSD